jgi:hypothetical protein
MPTTTTTDNQPAAEAAAPRAESPTTAPSGAPETTAPQQSASGGSGSPPNDGNPPPGDGGDDDGDGADDNGGGEKPEETRKKSSSKRIADIKIGIKDPAGSLVTDVLAQQPEFVVYEVEVKGRRRIKVTIGSDDPERYCQLSAQYNEIKKDFISALEYVYGARDAFSAKYMVAQALSFHLTSDRCPDTDDAGKDGQPEKGWFGRKKTNSKLEKSQNFFKHVINLIKDQVNGIPLRRTFYLLPFWLTVEAYVITFLANHGTPYDLEALSFSQKVHGLVLAAAIGGMLSATFNINRSPLDYVFGLGMCVLLGLERFFVSLGSSLVVFIAIESGYLIPALKEGNFLGTMMLCILAAFSEKFIPSFFEKIENRMQSGESTTTPPQNSAPPQQPGAQPPTPAGKAAT